MMILWSWNQCFFQWSHVNNIISLMSLHFRLWKMTRNWEMKIQVLWVVRQQHQQQNNSMSEVRMSRGTPPQYPLQLRDMEDMEHGAVRVSVVSWCVYVLHSRGIVHRSQFICYRHMGNTYSCPLNVKDD